MVYQLWPQDGGSIINAWETEEEALALVRAAVDAHGPDDVASWALLQNDPDGDMAMVAEGASLISLAQVTLAPACLRAPFKARATHQRIEKHAKTSQPRPLTRGSGVARSEQ
jgi:hypothetical protein